MIDPNVFVDHMTHHWSTTLNNVPSDALQKAWRQMASTFNWNIQAHYNPNHRTQWTILQPPTGAGKSQGTAVYASLLSTLLPPEEHPGMLIVTRLITDADQMASQINRMVGREVTVASHSEAEVALGELQNYPVLVITHRAYELALDHLGENADIESTFDLFHTYGSPSWDDFEIGDHASHRRLVVVDEALDIVEHSKAGLEGLRQTLGVIPSSVRGQYPEQVLAIQTVIDLLEQVEQRTKEIKKLQDPNESGERMLIKRPVTIGQCPDLTQLRATMRKQRYDLNVFHRDDPKANATLQRIHDERLRDLHNIFRTWMYSTAGDGKDAYSFNSARLLVPPQVKGVVVLDATAGSNLMYEVFDDAMVVSPPPGTRSYRNVTLHVSRNHVTGKRQLTANAKKMSQLLVEDLSERLSPDRKAFVVCHKMVEPVLSSFETPFDLSTGHWGAVDGSNQWQDRDTAVIFGLPHLPGAWAPNVFMAMQGPQATEWLRSSEARAFKRSSDIREALVVGQMTVSVVQAINRIRCRRVIDSEGNCPTSDVYIMLPKGSLGDALLEGIKREMPDIVVKEDWDIKAGKCKARRGNYDAALVLFAKAMRSGRVAVSNVKKELGIPARTFDRLAAKLKDEASDLYRLLVDAGVHYVIEGSGRAQRAYLVKGD